MIKMRHVDWIPAATLKSGMHILDIDGILHKQVADTKPAKSNKHLIVKFTDGSSVKYFKQRLVSLAKE